MMGIVTDDCNDTGHAFLVFARKRHEQHNDEWFYFMKLDEALQSKWHTAKIIIIIIK